MYGMKILTIRKKGKYESNEFYYARVLHELYMSSGIGIVLYAKHYNRYFWYFVIKFGRFLFKVVFYMCFIWIMLCIPIIYIMNNSSIYKKSMKVKFYKRRFK